MKLFNKKIRQPTMKPVTGGNLKALIDVLRKEAKEDVLQGMVLMANVTGMALHAWTGGNKTSAKRIMDDMIDQIWDQMPEAAPDMNRDNFFDVEAHKKGRK